MMIGQDKPGETAPKLNRLVEELGIAADDLRQWLSEFGEDVVTAGVVALDWDLLPFAGEW